MNPFLKHSILQFVGYEMMKKPTLEGIRADLSKESNKGSLGRMILPAFFMIQAIPNLLDGKYLWGIIGLLFGVIGYFLLNREQKQKGKRFKISDEEIVEQIDIHKQWITSQS